MHLNLLRTVICMNKYKYPNSIARNLSTFKSRYLENNNHAVTVRYQNQIKHTWKISHPLLSNYSQFSVINTSFSSRQTRFSTLALIEKLPPEIQPYLKLARLHAPIGFLLVYWPAAWAICLAAPAGHMPDVGLLSLFLLGAVAIRGAGCTLNDMIDRDLDKKVERTKNRPLASGALSMFDALVLLAGQLGISTMVLLQLNVYCEVLSVGALIPISLYPLAKRFFSWPQLFLGLTFNCGALIGWAQVMESSNWIAGFSLYVSCVCWTLFYDTIYALQDKKDDIKIGIKSTAIAFGSDTSKMLGYFTTAMTTGLVATGIAVDQTWPYYLSVALVSGHLIKQILTLNASDPEHCGKQFKTNNQIGLILLSGIIIGSLLKKKKPESDLPGLEIASQHSIE